MIFGDRLSQDHIELSRPSNIPVEPEVTHRDRRSVSDQLTITSPRTCV